MVVMMVALLNNLNYPSTQAIALTQRNDLNQLIQGMGCHSGSVGMGSMGSWKPINLEH